MNESQESPLISVAVVDTMTIHYVGLWLAFAEQHGLPLLPDTDTDSQSPDSTQILGQIEQKGERNALKRGFHTLSFLTKHQIQMEYCPVSTLELLSGKIRGRAILNASQEAIPERMWSRFHEKQVHERISIRDLGQARCNVASIFSKLEDLSGGISRTNPERTDDLLTTAEEVAGLVYVSTIDCVIYASALVAAADYIVTSDNYFKQLVNNIKDPRGDALYQEAKAKLTTFIGGERDQLPIEINLPKAFELELNGRPNPNPMEEDLNGFG